MAHVAFCFVTKIFKLRVQKSKDEGWYIFRRYSDFVRLNEIVSMN